MAELIQMRQRIKTIETIKKVTHAMRLISMSGHGTLKAQQEEITTYTREIDLIFNKLFSCVQKWKNPIALPASSGHGLIIIIGTQKGLCGSFNNILSNYFKTKKLGLPDITYDYVIIGQKTIEYYKHQHDQFNYKALPIFTLRNRSELTHQLVTRIFDASPTYQAVYLFGNQFKSFFTQVPHMTQLIPIKPGTATEECDQYTWYMSEKELLDSMLFQYIFAHIDYLLFQSLLAEQAARFLSMDNATRNAQSLLDASKLAYNKLRQSLITKELTELTGGFLSE